MAAVVVHAEDTVADTKLFGLMTQQCFDTFFVDMNFFHAECLKKLVSKGLGIAIIAGSFGLKIPQILTILKDRSVSGLEPAAFYLDVISFLATCCYNFLNGYPLTGWGESLVILVQNIFLVCIFVSSLLMFTINLCIPSHSLKHLFMIGDAVVPLLHSPCFYEQHFSDHHGLWRMLFWSPQCTRTSP